MGRTASAARLKEIEDEIVVLETVATEARQAGSFAPAVSALTRVGTLRADLTRLKSQVAIDKQKDPLKRVQMQRQLALADGSHGPASKLAQVEAQLVTALAQADALKAQAEMTDLGLDELIDIITHAVGNMAADDVERITAACDQRLADLGVETDTEYE